MQRSLVLIKPDAVQRGLIGEIVGRFEKKGVKIIGMKMINMTQELIAEHYAHLASKPFFPEIVSYMTISPIMALVVEGADVIPSLRSIVGATNPVEAAPGTIRGDLALTIRFNLIHASDSEETAAVEIPRFFKSEEIYSYNKIDKDLLY
jgi:nucleoside-diphosphate kinase